MSASFLLGFRSLRCFTLVLRSRGTVLSSHFTRFLLGFRSCAASPFVLRSRGINAFSHFTPLDQSSNFGVQAHCGAHALAQPACIPRCETGCDACSHKSAKSAENIELPYQWLRNDGGTEPERGHSVSFSWSAYPSVGR